MITMQYIEVGFLKRKRLLGMPTRLIKTFSLGVILTLTLSACSPFSSKTSAIALGEIPYTWNVPSDLAEKLVVEIPQNEYSDEAAKWGAKAQAIVFYIPENGERVNFMGAFYFPTKSYEAATPSNEPPPFGSKIIESNGMILSAWGPQDSIYEPESQDGKNITELYEYVYDPESYAATKG